jgi:cobalt/nickel transport system permease protein
MHHAVIDRLSMQSTFLHRLDARGKLIAAMLLTIFVISLGGTSISILVACAAGPFAMLTVSRVPFKLAGLQILCLSPFVAVFAVSMIFYDRSPVSPVFGPFEFSTTSGVLRCVVILFKFSITMTTLIVLSATTRFSDILGALSWMRLPRILVMQIALLHRYIFIIIDRACCVARARAGRKLGNLGVKYELKTTAGMLGNIAAFSTDMACRVSMAMAARGFTGTIEAFIKPKFSSRDALFGFCFAVYIGVLFLLKGIV